MFFNVRKRSGTEFRTRERKAGAEFVAPQPWRTSDRLDPADRRRLAFGMRLGVYKSTRMRKDFSLHPRPSATAALDPYRTHGPHSRAKTYVLVLRRASMWVSCVGNFRTARSCWTCSAFFPDSPSRKQMMGRARTYPANIQPSIIPQLFCPLLPSRILGQSYGGNHLPKGRTPFMAKRPVHFGCSFCGVVGSALDALARVWMRGLQLCCGAIILELPKNDDCVEFHGQASLGSRATKGGLAAREMNVGGAREDVRWPVR